MFVDLAQVHVITALAARLDFRCVKISLACFEPTHILHDAEGQTFAPQYDHLEQPAMVNFDDGKRCEGLVTEQAKTLRTYGMVVFGQPSANSRFVPVISSRPRATVHRPADAPDHPGGPGERGRHDTALGGRSIPGRASPCSWASTKLAMTTAC
jgi:hypothetical protein